MRCVIFDIDGTLSDVSGRVHHVSGSEKHWPSFFAAMSDDCVIEPVMLLAQMLHQNAKMVGDIEAVLIVTARPDDLDYRAVTVEWLSRHGITYDRLYMRRGGDYRADQVVKAEILEQILDDGYEPILVVDDRPQVVKMWRDHGITTLQCAPDEPRRSKYAGQTLLHILVGPCGAGKTTYREKNYQLKDIVSTDDLGVELYGHNSRGRSPEELARKWRYAHNLIRARLDVGVFTVLDATNLRQLDRFAVLECLPEGVFARYIVIDRDLGDKIKDRGWRSEDLILKHHRTLKSELVNILNGDHHPYVTVQDKRT